MSRRTVAGLVVAAALLLLVTVVVVVPSPYIATSPGPTVNVLGSRHGHAIVDVRGHRTYPTTGQLRLTTVSVTNPTTDLGLVAVLQAWLDPTRGVYPRQAYYPPEQSAAQIDQQNTLEMVSSQDSAIAAALHELGYRLPLRVEVLGVEHGAPADGRLRAGDRLLTVNGRRIGGVDQVSRAVQRTGIGGRATFVVHRGAGRKRVVVTAHASADDNSRAVVGIQVGVRYTFPFEVAVRLGQGIGGPSAGLIFSLAVYDSLTPGALAHDADIAGTGTITGSGRVGPIGGIQQKIVAASAQGAKVFLVPPANCGSALNAHADEEKIRLVKAPTMHSAVASLKMYADDPSTPLPSCR